MIKEMINFLIEPTILMAPVWGLEVRRLARQIEQPIQTVARGIGGVDLSEESGTLQCRAVQSNWHHTRTPNRPTRRPPDPEHQQSGIAHSTELARVEGARL